ncbi:suppressor of Mek1-like [Melanaphis sacchari]|uniref:suppressor of Mek1-like n=1 Tax=Melanaphis sacchari TaxID=742174 RepID=UPI000DC12D6A|nr:suppressor of Mek1-like [Melanaphis sacchari]
MDRQCVYLFLSIFIINFLSVTNGGKKIYIKDSLTVKPFDDRLESKRLQEIVIDVMIAKFKNRKMIDVSKTRYNINMAWRGMKRFLIGKMMSFFSPSIAKELKAIKLLKELVSKNDDIKNKYNFVLPFKKPNMSQKYKYKEENDEEDSEESDEKTNRRKIQSKKTIKKGKNIKNKKDSEEDDDDDDDALQKNPDLLNQLIAQSENSKLKMSSIPQKGRLDNGISRFLPRFGTGVSPVNNPVTVALPTETMINGEKYKSSKKNSDEDNTSSDEVENNAKDKGKKGASKTNAKKNNKSPKISSEEKNSDEDEISSDKGRKNAGKKNGSPKKEKDSGSGSDADDGSGADDSNGADDGSDTGSGSNESGVSNNDGSSSF